MDFILNAIDSASRQGQCFPAVVTALTVPDIAGAVDSPGAGSQARYVKWVDDWFVPKFPKYLEHYIDGVALYSLRCKLLHEGLSDPSQAPAAKKSAAASHKRLIALTSDLEFQCICARAPMQRATVGLFFEPKTSAQMS